MSEETLEEIKYYSEMYPDGIHKKSQAKLKIKDNVYLHELESKYNLEYDVDSDYEDGWSYETLDRDGVFIDLKNRQIYGIDATSLVLLYDLIQAGLVEKVEE